MGLLHPSRRASHIAIHDDTSGPLTWAPLHVGSYGATDIHTVTYPSPRVSLQLHVVLAPSQGLHVNTRPQLSHSCPCTSAHFTWALSYARPGLMALTPYLLIPRVRPAHAHTPARPPPQLPWRHHVWYSRLVHVSSPYVHTVTAPPLGTRLLPSTDTRRPHVSPYSLRGLINPVTTSGHQHCLSLYTSPLLPCSLTIANTSYTTSGGYFLPVNGCLVCVQQLLVRGTPS